MSDFKTNQKTSADEPTIDTGTNVSDGRNGSSDFDMPRWIGRYRVLDIVGAGGFGSVYRARDESLDRDVAIKIPVDDFSDRQHSERWNSEARMVAKLDHPNIVPVYDVGSSDLHPFFVVSKLIQGVDLRTRLRERKPSLDQSIAWTVDMADALQHSHEKGLVHRDVKPSNILIDLDDRAWLTDFGLALSDVDVGPVDGRRLLVGTCSYMSPEQARGEGHLVDGRADVFALGIVLYELLLGKRPFTGGSSQQVLQSIVRAEPRPLRQVDPRIPIELNRICMKALAQRQSDRYASARDMAEDLQKFSIEASTVDFSYDAAKSSGSGSSLAVAGIDSPPNTLVIPKGLRAFDEHDQSFFLKLLPGIRDAHGIPEVIRQLKIRIESCNTDEAFRVGLLYGSSGSGKSSLVRAGLVPLLDDSVEVVYVEANARHTESRLRNQLAPRLADRTAESPPPSLVETMAAVRRQGGADERKVLVILDQFEQWLHANAISEDAELVAAIRQCDGANLQCLVLIRDDFWMPATRFFYELDIRLVQGFNSTAVDRFDLRHARYVLAEFGRAYGCLPEDADQTSAEQHEFISRVVDSVQENGKVISIHLVVLAQILSSRQWNLKTLAEMRGIEGIDINFLDATFNDSNASPHHRSIKSPARSVLAELLPEMGTDIKGQMRSAAELKVASGLSGRRFDELIDVLDGELRMITPTVAIDTDEPTSDRYYQLTHDFLVPPLREWLTRSQRQSARGRTKLRLRELSQYWRRKHEGRFLPGALEYLQIMTLTGAADRNPDEAKLVAAATRHHLVRWSVVGILVLLFVWGAVWVEQRSRDRFAQREAILGVEQLLDADIGNVMGILETLAPMHQRAAPILAGVIDDPTRKVDEVLAARLALVDRDVDQIEPLIEGLMSARPDQLVLICQRLGLHQKRATGRLWELASSDGLDESRWLRVAFALAWLDPQDDRWNQHADRLATTVVNQNTPVVVQLAPGLSGAAGLLVRPLQRYFARGDQLSTNPGRNDIQLNAAIVLAECLSPSDPMLGDLLSIATPDQFELMISVAAEDPSTVTGRLQQELSKRPIARWPDEQESESRRTPFSLSVATELEASVVAAEGLWNDFFVLCQQVPIEQFDAFAGQLKRLAYRPECYRAYDLEGQTMVSVLWFRDGLAWKLTTHDGRGDVDSMQTTMRDQGLYPSDVTAVPSEGDGEVQYRILWTQAPPAMIDSRVYVGLSEDEHADLGWGPLAGSGYVPKTNLKLRDASGTDRYSSVRWRRHVAPEFDDAWNDLRYVHEERHREPWQPVDIRLNPAGEFDEQEISYSSVWWKGGFVESKMLQEPDPQSHLVECRRLAEAGFRPVSLSLVDDEDESPVAASVWQRPLVSEDGLDELAHRQANAIVALVRLGSTDSLWPYLESRPDPRLRSFLIDRLASLGIDPQVLVDRLMIDKDPSRRFAIIAALSRYRPEQLTSTASGSLARIIREWGSFDPRSSIHAISRHLAQRWGWETVLQPIDPAAGAPSKGEPNSDDPVWYTSDTGQTMVVINGPVEYPMGSPADELFRDDYLEVPFRCRIPHSFAIAATEVTVKQFQQFDAAVSYATEYTPSLDCPITSVSFVKAVCYCRWLSEAEGVDEDQMCYPTIDEIVKGAESGQGWSRPKNFLQRTGYRLPLEAEWEYACRANTTTPRFYGNSADLLQHYAWTTSSSTIDSQVQFHPVAQLLPNNFGLFDMLGNTMEWCETPQQDPIANSTVVFDDNIPLEDATNEYRIARGSAVFYVPTTMRCAKREEERVNATHPYLGFRIARTIDTLP